MKIPAFLLLLACCAPRIIQATIFPLFPRVGCFARFATFRFEITNFDKYTKYFHNDSAMSLWQTGSYVGAEAIEEYVKFATPETNPLYSSYKELDSKVKFVKFNRKSNQCQFLAFYHFNYEVDESSGHASFNFTVANMVKLYFDVKERYIPKIHVFYTEPYVNYAFTYLYNTDELRTYICNIYEGSTCSSILEPPDNCMAQLTALEQVSADGRIDGNTEGCRMLHSVLAQERNVHCPHISFEPMADVQGKIKCQTEGTLTVVDLFTQDDLDAYADYASGRGLDPDVGHDGVE